MSEEQLFRCEHCRGVMKRAFEERHPDGLAFLDGYQCDGCGRKAVLYWEMTGRGVTPEVRGWVEREIAKKGSFFPSDFTR